MFKPLGEHGVHPSCCLGDKGGVSGISRGLFKCAFDRNDLAVDRADEHHQHGEQGGNCQYGAGAGWGNVTGGYKQGKNVITCANLDALEVLDPSSSRGPAVDGRIKPDISSNGRDQISTAANNTYQVGGGTSAACPGIAGICAQLAQAYKELNSAADSPLVLAASGEMLSNGNFHIPGLALAFDALAMATQTSDRSSESIPWNPSAATPTTTNGDPLREIARPTTEGSDANRFSQIAWLITATGAAPATSSSGLRARPSRGSTPRPRRSFR